MSILNELSAQEIGRRLRIARENVGLRQEEAASEIGVSRPTLISIEKGTRRVRIGELQLLAKYYQTTVNSLLRREAVFVNLVPRFRKSKAFDDIHSQEAVQLVNDLVRAEVELENILGITPKFNYPPERGINEGDVRTIAEDHAMELRNWLNIGTGSISNLFSLIEFDLGIRLYQRKLSSGSKISGLFTYDPAIGACILLNANHRLSRRIQSASHELGHFYCNRNSLEIQSEYGEIRSREEQYAKAFGFAFTMPKDKFIESFRRLTEGADKLTRRHIILLSSQFNVSREACVRRLENLELIKKGTWLWFENNGGITDEQVESVIGKNTDFEDKSIDDSSSPLPEKLGLMAFLAWKKELLSEGQLVDLLRIDRIELRDYLSQFDIEEYETDDILKLS